MPESNGTEEASYRLADKEPWTKMMPMDVREGLLQSNESFTAYGALDLLGIHGDNPIVKEAHKRMLSDPLVIAYINRLSDWEHHMVTGHNKADYLPNQLWLLLQFGIFPKDSPRMEPSYKSLLSHQDPETGQFLALCRIKYGKAKPEMPIWTSVLCDHNMITSVLLLAGYANDSRVKVAVELMSSLISETSQGYGWKCVPGLNTGFRGPGCINDICPMAVVDALRGYWILPRSKWPAHLMEAGKSLLKCWSNRAAVKPYMFGHGRNFRMPRAPFFWYNIGTVLDAVSHYEELVKTEAFREMLSVSRLAFGSDGWITPNTIYLDFKGFSFGQKKVPSPWLTLFLARIYKRAAELDKGIVEKVFRLDGNSYRGSK